MIPTQLLQNDAEALLTLHMMNVNNAVLINAPPSKKTGLFHVFKRTKPESEHRSGSLIKDASFDTAFHEQFTVLGDAEPAGVLRLVECFMDATSMKELEHQKVGEQDPDRISVVTYMRKMSDEQKNEYVRKWLIIKVREYVQRHIYEIREQIMTGVVGNRDRGLFPSIIKALIDLSDPTHSFINSITADQIVRYQEGLEEKRALAENDAQGESEDHTAVWREGIEMLSDLELINHFLNEVGMHGLSNEFVETIEPTTILKSRYGIVQRSQGAQQVMVMDTSDSPLQRLTALLTAVSRPDVAFDADQDGVLRLTENNDSAFLSDTVAQMTGKRVIKGSKPAAQDDLEDVSLSFLSSDSDHDSGSDTDSNSGSDTPGSSPSSKSKNSNLGSI